MKTKAVIMLNKANKMPVNERDFLSRIFWKHDLTEQALIILEKIPFSDKDWKNIIKNDMTQSNYYSAIGRMKTMGLINKTNGVFRLSGEFSTMLNNLAEYWDAYTKRLKEKNKE